jgi:NAD-dependent SIR2 family protein deacetylase
MPADIETAIEAAAVAIQKADALLIGAGAGMGVDSGLPDFRGPEGFWKAYPAFHGKRFAEISTPHWFETDPALAWGFFGHRLQLYRRATPHAGFNLLQRWGERKPGGCFVFTSNVDGQFQKAGFPANQVLECHGSIHHLQCTKNCGHEIWPADAIDVKVDEPTTRAISTLPTCPGCQSLARPNILMFGDWHWDSTRSQSQMDRYQAWLDRVQPMNVVAIELGAGTAIPTVREECTRHARTLIRINPVDAYASRGQIALPLGALDALRQINEQLA